MDIVKEYWTALGAMEFAGNTVRALVLAAAFFFAVAVVLRLAMGVILMRLKQIAPKTRLKADDVLLTLFSEIGVFSYAAVALYFATRPLALPELVDKVVFAVFLLAILYQGVRIAERFAVFVVQRFWFRRRGSDGDNVWGVLVFVIRVVLWSIGLLLLLSNLGFNVTSLIASLGMGGVAIALAVQNILGDLFSSFSLYLDEPFKVGDFIITGEHMGTVKKVGLKTTRIQSLEGEEIVIPNQELTNARVRNYKRMNTRRIEFGFGVVYETPPKVEKVPVMVREIFSKIDNAKLDRAHFKGIGEYRLDFAVVYIVESSDYNVYMDVQQRVNLEIMRALEREGIRFAYPTTTIRPSAAENGEKNSFKKE